MPVNLQYAQSAAAATFSLGEKVCNDNTTNHLLFINLQTIYHLTKINMRNEEEKEGNQRKGNKVHVKVLRARIKTKYRYI
jgi:hypothetical protein